jgi:CubicO group peptidase (beta-lactamase class C family)
MNTRISRLLLLSTAFGMFAGCAASKNISAKPPPERDIKTEAARLEGATVLDVAKFQPTAKIAGCSVRVLPSAKVESSLKLTTALKAAQTYNEQQKGVGLIVMKDGKIIHESYAVGADANTPTDSFSMHKSVLSLMYGIAVDDGIIGSINDPIGKYISEWKNDPRGKITIAQFLHMESGLEPSSGLYGPSGFMTLLLSTDINTVALQRQIKEPPGTVFKYNNVNSQIAGVALERTLKKHHGGTYAEYLKRKLWCPVGNSKAEIWLDREGGAPHYYSGIFTVLHNWARLGELIRLNGNVGDTKIVSAGWIKEMEQPSSTNANYGLHIWRGSPWIEKRKYSLENPLAAIHGAPYLADDVYFFDGFGGQRVYVIASAGVTIARTGYVNFEYDDAKIVNLVLAAL